MARLWVDAINRHGGDARFVHLPTLGIRGNTHFLFSDLNNVADREPRVRVPAGQGPRIEHNDDGDYKMNWLPRFGIAAVIAVLVGMSGPAQTQQPKEPPAMAKTGQTRAQQLMGDIAPKLAELTDNVLFGDVWERPALTKRDRSLVTISALIAMNRPDQLRSHLALARQNSVTETEIIEAITHLAFYAGWPNAVSAVAIAREVFAQK